MTYFKSFESQPSLTFTGNGVPSISTIGARVDDVYLNLSTGEAFRCHDSTFGNQVWHGSQSTIVISVYNPNYAELTVHYTMDNISGSALVDEQGNYDGTITGALTVPGLFGNALKFSGNTTDKVTISPLIPLGTDDFSISMWIKLDPNLDAGGDYYLIDFLGTNNTGFDLYFRADASYTGRQILNIRQYNGGLLSSSGVDYIAEKLYHIVLVFDRDANLKYYVDGVNTNTTSIVGTTFNSATQVIGGTDSLGIGDHSLAGWIDQFRLYHKALSPEEVAGLYEEPGVFSILDYRHSNLVVAYTFDNITGSTIHNETGATTFDAVYSGGGGVPVTVPGIIGNALDTNANGSGHAYTPNHFLNGTDSKGTLSYWSKYTGSTGWLETCNLYGSSGSGIYIETSVSASRTDIYLRNQSSNINKLTINSSILGDGNWHHVVFMSDGSTYTFYIDGVAQTLIVDTGANDGAWWNILRAGQANQLGWILLGENQWSALTDMVRYYDRDLTSGEVGLLLGEGS